MEPSKHFKPSVFYIRAHSSFYPTKRVAPLRVWFVIVQITRTVLQPGFPFPECRPEHHPHPVCMCLGFLQVFQSAVVCQLKSSSSSTRWSSLADLRYESSLSMTLMNFWRVRSRLLLMILSVWFKLHCVWSNLSSYLGVTSFWQRGNNPVLSRARIWKYDSYRDTGVTIQYVVIYCRDARDTDNYLPIRSLIISSSSVNWQNATKL